MSRGNLGMHGLAALTSSPFQQCRHLLHHRRNALQATLLSSTSRSRPPAGPLFTLAKSYYCELQAWTLFSNHYHLVVISDVGEALQEMLARFHSDAAKALNAFDGVSGRRVWYQFWDTQLTFEKAWLARLKYTHENAVKHGVVSNAKAYRWCSAAWFEENARPSLVKTLQNVKIDRVNVYDDFAVECGGNASAFQSRE